MLFQFTIINMAVVLFSKSYGVGDTGAYYIPYMIILEVMINREDLEKF